MKSDIRSHQITLEESNRNSLVQLEVNRKIEETNREILLKLEQSNKNMKENYQEKIEQLNAEFKKGLNSTELLVGNIKSKQNSSLRHF